MNLDTLIHHMPKVELHVHFEGSIRPETLLKLAKRNHVALPANTVEGLRQWYTFTSFNHFVEVYVQITRCMKTVADIELVAREFLEGQAAQNICYSEVTYTAWTINRLHGISFSDQRAALNRARVWAKRELNTDMQFIVDIPRGIPFEEGMKTAHWAIEGYGDGVIAMGLGGPEVGNPPELYREAFDRVRAKGIPCILHAGETVGPESIWSALRTAGSLRIGHGVRAIEDPTLMAYLKATQTPLEVCPTSNVCLGVYPSLAQHSLPQLMEYGLFVTLNSDDPPMFNTTLTNEYIACARAFGWSADTLRQLAMNAVQVALLPSDEKQRMTQAFQRAFTSAVNQLSAE